GRYETRNKAKVRKFYHNDSFTRFIVDVGYARTRRSLDGNQEFIDYNHCIIDRFKNEHNQSLIDFVKDKLSKKTF
ncbi:MAG: hypothetical protein ACRCX2_17045, partial [Paraclostridium sp.]